MSNFNSADIAAFKDVWVFCEQREGKLMPTDFELISKGRDLANELGVNLCGLLLGGEGIESAAKELGGYGADKVLVSVAAGISLKSLREAAGDRCAVVRCMPNTPALVGKGVFAFSFEEDATSESKAGLMELFGALGLCLELPEARFTAFSALIGAGPAYVFEMMQGLVQAGVTLGFQHKEARRMVAALFAGSARIDRKSVV